MPTLTVNTADLFGEPREGVRVEIAFVPDSIRPVDYNLRLVHDYTAVEKTDSSGEATFELIASADLNPATNYRARIYWVDPIPEEIDFTMPGMDANLVTLLGNRVPATQIVTARGHRGWSPILGVVSDGDRRVFQVEDWVGGEGLKPTVGQYIGPTGLVGSVSQGVDIRGTPGAQGNPGNPGPQGNPGGPGPPGDDGWEAITAVASDGTRRVLQVTGWFGGTGTAPTTTGFIGPTGFVSDIRQAVDLRGPAGAAAGSITTTTATVDRRVYGTAFTMNPLTNNGAVTTTAHGLSQRPDSFEIVLTCLVANHGYTVGQQILFNESQPDRLALWVSDTQYGGRLRERPWIAGATSGASHGLLTAASWSMTITPYFIESVSVITGVGGASTHTAEQYVAIKATNVFEDTDFTGGNGVEFAVGTHTATVPSTLSGNVYIAFARLNSDPDPTFLDFNGGGLNQFGALTKSGTTIMISSTEYAVWVSNHAGAYQGTSVEFR